MRALPVVFASTVSLAVGMASMWWWNHHAASPPSPVVASASADKQVLYWYDPMQPNQHFDHPGKSPFMDMQLLPKYASNGEDAAGVVQIDPRQVQNLGVRTAPATSGVLASTVRATGTVAFDESAVSLIQARVAGIVEQLLVRAPLTEVKRGQPLLTLLAPEWSAAQEEYLSLRRAQSQGLDAMRDAARSRLLLLGMDEGQIRTIERSGQAQTHMTLTAPRDGVIGELAVRDGASVMAGTPLLRINGLDSVWVNAAIPQSQAARVHVGATVSSASAAFPGERLVGKVDALLPDVDSVTRTQTARIVLRNPQHRLVPGQFAQIEIAGGSEREQVLVPSEAVIATGTRSVVIVAEGKGRFRAQEVRVGDEVQGYSAIVAGLNAGDTVVLSGQFLIDSEASLSGTLARLDDTASTSGEAAGAAAPRERHHAAGAIKAMDGLRWSIATDAIASLDMPAMAMTFVVPPSVPAQTVRVGTRVRFTFVRNDDGDFEIVEFAPADAQHGDAP